MATAVSCSVFSSDGEYFAHCGIDGKLKIWDTSTGRLKQEYVSNFHLSSPCCVLTWLYVNSSSTNAAPSPWKKRRRKSISEESTPKGIVAMGSTNGKITLYDTTTSSVTGQLDGHSGTVTAVTWSENVGLFSASDDYHIIHWNLKENGVKCKWKSGKGKTTSLAVSEDGKSLLSGERVVKWWDLSTKQLIKTFTGHANQVTCLCTIKMPYGSNYVISGACGDGCLSVWALDDQKPDRTPVASLALQDDAISVSVNISKESQVIVLVITRSGQAHLFHYQQNGRSKPLKPSLNIAVASDISQKEGVQQIPILDAKLTEDQKLLLAYGAYLSPTFERMTPDYSNKVQCLVRSENRKNKEKKDEISKVKNTIIEDNVEYLAPGLIETAPKRNRNSSGSQLLLKDRLENLSLNAETSPAGKSTSVGSNRAQLLLQGLNSKDKAILSSIFVTRNESIVRNTIAKLPTQAIDPLIKELTILLQGKTFTSKLAVRWLEALLMAHAGHLLSQADLMQSFGPILSLIDAKLALLPEISKLKGRVSLVTGQISQTVEEQHKDVTENCLVYQDSDSSEEDGGIEDEDLESESDENWEEMSNQEDQDDQEEQNDKDVRSTNSDADDDDESISS
ncbi:PREDICTED: WD repeat-containing protein 43 [Dufourea novaeangliae]|uniref:WD repeat-containing protein 43 n=1 Tax=Dufourea novaeangliae TaxID=178035 RepID=A0A154P5U4_DUFNO|nr:PREDICTED: WD repeat-containing protein 43 [Dufourea novaeangliae]KZC07222.1 WD repeat-containing protein 43 [Dufourea novaeangliae]